MSDYMKHTHPDAFRDCQPMTRRPDLKLTVQCPKCHGHGKWNLTLDAYGPGEHFQMACSQCNSWGWVRPGIDETCIHDWHNVEKLGNCLHLYKCSKCGKRWEVDSSG